MNTFFNHFRSLSKRFAVLMGTGLDRYIVNISQLISLNSNCPKSVPKEVNKAVRELDPIYAVPFIKYFEGYRYHEIAKELDMPVGTVKTHIRIARQILRADLTFK